VLFGLGAVDAGDGGQPDADRAPQSGDRVGALVGEHLGAARLAGAVVGADQLAQRLLCLGGPVLIGVALGRIGKITQQVGGADLMSAGFAECAPVVGVVAA